MSIKYWVDPGYQKQVEVFTGKVAEQSAIYEKLKTRLQESDLEYPQARTARASGNIGGISLYFSGTVRRKQLAFELNEAKKTLTNLKAKLSEYKNLVEKSKQPL
jgi:DNA-binding MarR family transcriptional regulator